jgi:hypothetical protein
MMHSMHHSVLLAQWYCGEYGALLTPTKKIWFIEFYDKARNFTLTALNSQAG